MSLTSDIFTSLAKKTLSSVDIMLVGIFLIDMIGILRSYQEYFTYTAADADAVPGVKPTTIGCL